MIHYSWPSKSLDSVSSDLVNHRLNIRGKNNSNKFQETKLESVAYWALLNLHKWSNMWTHSAIAYCHFTYSVSQYSLFKTSFFCYFNYLPSIYIVSGTICHLGMISSIQEGVWRLLANTMPFYIKDLSMCRFWLEWAWNCCPAGVDDCLNWVLILQWQLWIFIMGWKRNVKFWIWLPLY